MSESYVSPEDFVDPNQPKSQDDIEYRMLLMQEPIKRWEDAVAAAHASGDKEAQLGLAGEAIDQLDELWGYTGENFLVAGTWRQAVPNFEAEESNPGALKSYDGALTWSIQDVDVCQEAVSRGISWTSVDGKPRVSYLFNLEGEYVGMPFIQIGIQMQAAALPEKVSLMHVGEYTPNNEEDKEAELKRFLLERDQLLRRCLNREEFLKLRHARQQGLVKGLVEDADESILEPGSQMAIAFDCSHAYERVDVSTGYGIRRIDSVELASPLSTQPITGIILGVGIVEEPVLETKPLRRKEDFIDQDAGLCIIVETLFEEGPSRVVKVPLQAINLEEASIQLY